MNLNYFQLVVPVIIALFGWYFVHFLNAKRDVSNKRRELRLKYLIENYLVLTNDFSHRNESPERSRKIERALLEIQLFGTRLQIELAKNLIDDMINHREHKLDPLINTIRDDLRENLELDAVTGNVHWIRIYDDIANNQNPNS